MLSRLALFAVLLLPVATALAGGESDYVRRQVPATTPPPPYQPEFQFSFGTAARWPGKVLHWRYNNASAPYPFSADEAGTIQKLVATAAKWSAACGIQFVYDGTTSATPTRPTDANPDNVNVVGWRELDPGTIGLTYTWNGSPPNADMLVDADVMFSPSRFARSPPSTIADVAGQMDRTASHEWGHAIGIGHSNLSDALMSGLPDSPYSYVTDPQPDDIRACRCLYGPAPSQLAAYACSLPTIVDFGVQTVGAMSAAKRVNFINDSTATLPLTVGGTTIASGEFFVTGTTCTPSTPLAPGAGCTIDLAARPGISGTRTAEAVIATSDGAYRLPLAMDGYAPPTPPVTLNFQGLWWNAPGGSESGWGLNVAHQGDKIFATWFTYDAGGHGWWLVMTADKTGPNTYSGALLQSQGPAFNAVPFSPAAVNAAVGMGTLTFASGNNGTFSYTLGGVMHSKAITRQVFGPLPVCTWGLQPNLALATNYQDLWWAAPAGAESGWGINLNHQGDTIFATWFTYDLDGAPLWLVVTALKTGANVYGGDLYRTTGPAFSAVPFDPLQVVSEKVGTATFTFADGNSASFAYSVQLAGMPAPVGQTKTITREVFTAPGTACR